MSFAPTVVPGVLPTISPVRADYVDIVEELFQRASTPLIDLGALASDSSCGQIYHPLNGAKKSSGSIQLARLPMAGAPGGAVSAVAAFQEWDVLLPEDIRDWSDGAQDPVTRTLIPGYPFRYQVTPTTTHNQNRISLQISGTPSAANLHARVRWSDGGGAQNMRVRYGGVSVDKSVGDDWADIEWAFAGQTDAYFNWYCGNSVANARPFQVEFPTVTDADYAKPQTGLAAGTTREKTIATASATPGDDCSLILVVIPYGRDITDSDDDVNFCVSTSGDWDYFNVFTGGTPDKFYAFRSGNAGANNAHWYVDRADFASLGMFDQDKVTTLGVDFVAGESVIGYVNGARAGGSSGTLPATLDAITEVTIGHNVANDRHVNGIVAGMLTTSSLTATEHAAIAACLGAGRYYTPQS